MAGDTDVLAILLRHYKFTMADIIMQYKTVGRGDIKVITMPVQELHMKIGDRAASQLICVHAVTRRDTTSSLVRHDKVSVWRQLTGSNEMRHLTDVIRKPDASQSEVLRAGLELLVMGNNPLTHCIIYVTSNIRIC